MTRYHNNRIIIDPWKGQAFPVITDAQQDFDTKTNLISSMTISILNQSSKFIDLNTFI